VLHNLVAITLALAAQYNMAAQYNIGRAPTADEIRGADITVLPDGSGLPAGKGDAAAGEIVYSNRCAECHGTKAAGRKGEYPALVGGRGTLATAKPVKTVGSYWPYATTLWDEINRAMPFNTPRVLRPDDVYAVTAYILYLNGVVTRDQQLNEKTLPKIVMPNRSGFILDTRPDIKSRR
jgi:S-disulfanyl-L-cysteine oxidoreductase SoxD